MYAILVLCSLGSMDEHAKTFGATEYRNAQEYLTY
jgi:hypothetical protein